ncbi:reverse transcriptase domain-containing protein [Tanacetum coccineum]
MKKLIAELPTLTAPMEKEELIVYLAAAREAVSAVLMTKREAKQIPIYFAIRALQDGSGARLILTNPDGTEFTYALRFEFDATNNEADYEAMIAGMIQYPWKVKTLENSFKKFSIKQVSKSENKKAGALSKIASTSFAHLTKQVLVEVLKEKYINRVEVLIVVEEEGNTWMTPIYEYLTEETLPAKRKKARAIQLKIRRMHAGPRSGVSKAIRTGYYWPTMHKDARKMIRECQDCQVHCPVPRNPQKKLTPITSPWPFYK